jgi:serine/threonine-protein kinase
MFEALAGQVPFSASTGAEVCKMHLENVPPRLPGSLGAIIARCLAKSPADRYADAGALESALVGEIEPGVQVAA